MLRTWCNLFVVALIAGAMGSAALAVPQDEPAEPKKPSPPMRRPPALPPDMPSSEPMTIADRIAEAHNVRAWRAHDAFTCNITVNFGGQTMLEGTMLVDTSKDRVRFDLTNGVKLVWDGEHAWVSPADAMIESPRYHLRTWPFFLKAPFELRGPGKEIETMNDVMIDKRIFSAFKLTFTEKSDRETPNDWFIVYSDIVTHTLYGMAYISTWGGRSVKDAEMEPHIVLFEEPAILNTVVIPQTWSFYRWSEAEGKQEEMVGKATLRNISFTQLREDTFKKPEDAREVKRPKPAEEDDEDDDDEPSPDVPRMGVEE